MSIRSSRILAVTLTLVLVFGVHTGAQAASQARLGYDFEQGIKIDPSNNLRYVVDTTGSSTGQPHKGYLKGANGGAVRLVTGGSTQGLVAKFPEPCSSTGCPKAMIQTVASQSDDLNPRSAPFSFGAWLLMRPSHLTGGSNIMQKGLYNDPGGQWKLQVDTPRGNPGHPSCSVRVVIDGRLTSPITVEASGVNVADERWHRVVCRKTDDRLYVIVDGAVRNSISVPRGAIIRNNAPVSVGAKHLSSDNNDQFHGALNDVYFRLD